MSTQSDLRLAIMSDIHLGFKGHINPNYYGLEQKGDQNLWVEYALRYFKDKGIDALVIPGDMANACRYSDTEHTSADYAAEEMREFGEMFRRVFQGSDVKLVTIYGNHDNLCQNRERLNGGDGSPWEDAFLEPYRHINEYEVKGYRFIGANWGYEKEAKPYIDKAVSETPDKPVFYLQHDSIKNTTCDSYTANVCDIGLDALADYDNIIALFGHTHCPITDERTIWQSADEGAARCTVISCSTFNYADSTGDLVRGENLMTKHALYLTVNNKDVNIERLSFWTDEMLALAEGKKTEQNMSLCTKSAGADWNFTIGGERVLDFKRRAESAKAPEFPETAVAGLARGDTFVVVFFPAAIPLACDNDLLHDYYVEAYEDNSGELVSSGTVCTEFHIDHSSDYLSPYYQIVVPYLKPDTHYTFKVYARDCWGKKSTRPIIHHGKTMAKPDTRLW